ncbi:DCC1-like thiol-disulfide oxidoreductase family protein [Natrialbaceae archaeon A-arb3/5]
MVDATLVFDDDCGFCTWWAEYFEERTALRIVGYRDLTPELRERLPDDYESCSHLVTDDDVYSCGASIEEALVRTDVADPLTETIGFLRHFEDYEKVREHGYRWVANNRDAWGQVMSKTPPARRDSNDD